MKTLVGLVVLVAVFLAVFTQPHTVVDTWNSGIAEACKALARDFIVLLQRLWEAFAGLFVKR